MPGGTLLECQASTAFVARLQRDTAGHVVASSIACPGKLLLSNDQQLSYWKVIADDGQTILAQAATSLPAPKLVLNGPTAVILDEPWSSFGTPRWVLEAVSDSKVESVDAEMPLPDALVSQADVKWRWSLEVDGRSFRSTEVPIFRMQEQDLGYWGALAVGDLGDGRDTLLGMQAAESGDGPKRYASLGLGALFDSNRDFRDVRIVDLDNDGTNDVVANVYGSGCLIVGMHERSGGYRFSEPLSSDGTCISGNGETLLVADFDGDGLVDIFVPTYQQFYLLRNLGGGHFEDMTAVAGIVYPEYRPAAEGAAAGDINGDGAVDIITGSEVLINDGHARFKPMPNVYGAERVFDEGLSVADLDNDGVFDIVKNDPSLGPRVYWGRATNPVSFDDGGYLLEGEPALNASFGLAVGNVTSDDLSDVVVAGGAPPGRLVVDGKPLTDALPPILCAQKSARSFRCMRETFAVHPNHWQDLLLLDDLDGDGAADLVARYGTLRLHRNPLKPRNVFRFDWRDALGHRTMYGHVAQARCTLGNKLIGTKFVDGGNGYMAQGHYIMTFTSDWCSSVNLVLRTATGDRTIGPFSPGDAVIAGPASGG